jgi:hypothetical protein
LVSRRRAHPLPSAPLRRGPPHSERGEQKVTGNESVRRCVQGVRAPAARCGPLRTGATGLEPAASGVTERGSAAQSPRKHVFWGL